MKILATTRRERVFEAIMLFFVVVLMAFAAFSCHPTPEPVPTPKPTLDASAPPVPEAGPSPDAGACGLVFKHMELLGCPPAHPRTGTWIEVCANAERHGIDFRLSCFADAVTCEQVEACGK